MAEQDRSQQPRQETHPARPTNGEEHTAYAEFADRDAARRAVRDLASQGVDAQRIWLDAHAPEQSGAPVDQAAGDERTARRYSKTGAKGMVIGGIIGAVIGAIVGFPLMEATAPALAMAIGVGAFGVGFGFLVTMISRVQEGEHRGTVTDEPDRTQPVRVAVPCADQTERERVEEQLAQLGGRIAEAPPHRMDHPDR